MRWSHDRRGAAGVEDVAPGVDQLHLGNLQLRYEPALDGLRAVAAIAVLGFHAHIPGFSNGSLGVDVFFTLSGFLITSVLLGSMTSSGQVDYRAFYVRRARRLLPAYFLVLTVAVLGDFVIDVGGTLKGAVASFFYLANVAVGTLGMGLGSLEHTWSLSVEEQFYLVWPLTLTFLVRWTRAERSKLVATIAGLIAASYLATIICVALGVPGLFLSNATPARAVQLLAGAALAVVARRNDSAPKLNSRWLADAGGTVALGGLLAMFAIDPPSGSFTISVLWPAIATLSCAVIAAGRVRGTFVSRLLSFRLLVRVGKMSYGLYLWHFVVFSTIDAALGLESWEPRILGLVVTAVIVPLSYRYVELPFLRRSAAGAPNTGIAETPGSDDAQVQGRPL